MSRHFIIGSGLLIGAAGLTALVVLLSSDAPDSGPDHDPLVHRGASSETAAAPLAAVSDPPRGAAVEAAVIPRPAPLDCERPSGPVALVAGRGVPAAVLCDALAATVGAPGTAWRRQGPELLERLVEHALLRRELETRGLAVSEAELDAELVRRGAADASPYVRAEIEARLALRLLVGHAERPNDRAALEAEYRSAPERWAVPGRARLDGYLARTPVGAPPETLAEAERRAARVVEVIASGGSEVAAATESGMEPLSGWALESSGLEPALEAAVFSVDGARGTWLGPIRTRVGWVVARASAVVMPAARPFEEVEADVRRAVEARAELEAEHAIVARLRRTADIARLVVW